MNPSISQQKGSIAIVVKAYKEYLTSCIRDDKGKRETAIYALSADTLVYEKKTAQTQQKSLKNIGEGPLAQRLVFSIASKESLKKLAETAAVNPVSTTAASRGLSAATEQQLDRLREAVTNEDGYWDSTTSALRDVGEPRNGFASRSHLAQGGGVRMKDGSEADWRDFANGDTMPWAKNRVLMDATMRTPLGDWQLDNSLETWLWSDCLPCLDRLNDLFDFPISANLLNMLGNMLDAKKALLDNIMGLFNNTDIYDDLCAILQFMNFQCIPDLNMLWGLLKALLDDIASSLEFTLEGLLSTLLGALLAPYLNDLEGLLNHYLELLLAPINCILAALAQQISKIPGTDSLVKGMRDMQTRLNGEVKNQVQENVIGHAQDPTYTRNAEGEVDSPTYKPASGIVGTLSSGLIFLYTYVMKGIVWMENKLLIVENAIQELMAAVLGKQSNILTLQEDLLRIARLINLITTIIEVTKFIKENGLDNIMAFCNGSENTDVEVEGQGLYRSASGAGGNRMMAMLAATTTFGFAQHGDNLVIVTPENVDRLPQSKFFAPPAGYGSGTKMGTGMVGTTGVTSSGLSEDAQAELNAAVRGESKKFVVVKPCVNKITTSDTEKVQEWIRQLG